MKTILIVLLCAAFCFVFAPIKATEMAIQPSTDYFFFEAIKAYWSFVNEADWNNWVQCIAPSVRKEAVDLISFEDNFTNNIGILTVEEANVLSASRIKGACPFASFYPEIADYLKNESSFACYRVETDMHVREENSFFTNGVNSLLFSFVLEDGKWYVAEVGLFPDETSGTRTVPPGSLATMKAVPSCKTEPDTVSVKDDLNQIHKYVDFDEYMLNVIYHEIGYQYPKQAIYANIIGKTVCFLWL